MKSFKEKVIYGIIVTVIGGLILFAIQGNYKKQFEEFSERKVIAQIGESFLTYMSKSDYELAKGVCTKRTIDLIEEHYNFLQDKPDNIKIHTLNVELLGNRARYNYEENTDTGSFYTSIIGLNLNLIKEDGQWLVDIEKFWYCSG